MNRRALLISGASTVAGIGLLRLHLARTERRLSGGPATDVLVLRKDLRAGTPLTRSALGTRALPASYLESRHVPAADLGEVLDARLGIDARAGETLLWTDLDSMRQRGRQLAQLVPEGMRAVPVHAAGLSHLLHPGDRVDVLAAPGDRAHADAVQVAVQNAMVLAVGSDLGGNGSGDRPTSRSARGPITLAVTLEQSRQLAAAGQDRQLHLVLRNPGDVALAEARGGAAVLEAGAR